MTDLLTAAQMRKLEQAAIDSGAVTGLELMERAGAGVVAAVLEEWPELAKTAHRAVVLCGPGNNGGDGFVVARLLHLRGWQVEVFLYGDPEKMPPDARVNFVRWTGLGSVQPLAVDTFPNMYEHHIDLFCDALFGTGLTRPVEGEPAKVLSHIRRAMWPGERSRRAPEHLVAIDIPTSLCSDSGEVLKTPDVALAHFRADLTVTFHAPKVGHYLEAGPELSGKVVVKEIGLQGRPRRFSAAERVERVARAAQRPPSTLKPGAKPRTLLQTSPGSRLGKEDWSHKYDHGHALILSGGPGRAGAARLAARGALRIGAGLVTLGVPPAAQLEVAGQITAIMLRRVADAEGLAALLDDDRLNALCLGPGLGLDRARDLVPVALGRVGSHPPYAGRAVVLDADALSAFEDAPGALFAMLHDTCILTPHAGEFKRLFPDIAARLAEPPTKGPAYSKVDATRDAAARAGCTILYKGPDTVIAAPDGRSAINASSYDRAAPWLATAGSGDVLAGFIAGLLARGFAPMQAAQTAAWLHTECALEFGPGLIAEDLPKTLPRVFRALGL